MCVPRFCKRWRRKFVDVRELVNRLTKLEHENGQLKKAVLGSRLRRAYEAPYEPSFGRS